MRNAQTILTGEFTAPAADGDVPAPARPASAPRHRACVLDHRRRHAGSARTAPTPSQWAPDHLTGTAARGGCAPRPTSAARP
jgi:hypothetical protein